MAVFAAATVLAWLLSLWLGLGAFRARGCWRQLQRLLRALLFAGLGMLLAALLLILHAFRAFSSERLVARVTTRRLASSEFELS
ncbi:MAG: hypothetical protein HYZ91_03025 [Candidatus Omnitrophica bacterium]|nr:hypothetical protein [Candidatus Omnitrophota bacterium]